MANVNREAKLLEEVSSQYWLLHVGDDECPSECPPETKVHCERTDAICSNVHAVDSLKTEVSLMADAIEEEEGMMLTSAPVSTRN